jgi:trehalose 6-phosphate phosphatase
MIPDRPVIYLYDFFPFLCTISLHGSCLLSKFELCWPTKFLSRKSTAGLLKKAKNILRYRIPASLRSAMTASAVLWRERRKAMTMRNQGNKIGIEVKNIDAVIFDLDGVITKTASVHAAVWKNTFDRFLTRKAGEKTATIKLFDIVRDYKLYVDGKTREDGIRSFLQSRGMSLPEGNPDERPGLDSIQAIGNMKNRLFLQILSEDGVEPYPTTLDFVRQVKTLGIKTAVISASRNCALILERAGIPELFDVRVDGVDAAKLGLSGKPAPDIFLEADRQLGVDPSRTIVVEDAVAGVAAARAGGFALVVGVSRTGERQVLLSHGAHVAVDDLSEIEIKINDTNAVVRPKELPSAIDNFMQIEKGLNGRRPAVFLDYDGTLTPIVETPDKAVLGASMRSALLALNRSCVVGIISGRGLADIRCLVGIEGLIYAGSHGFEIAGPVHVQPKNSEALAFLPIIDKAEQEIRDKISPIEGSLVERKKFGIAIHYRLVDPGRVPAVEAAVDEVASKYGELRKAYGKKVFELQPAMDWHKGKALQFVLKAMKLDDDEILPFYIGDDVTDEDAFRALINKGCGIVVWDRPFPTAARYCLKSCEEVRRFILLLAEHVGGVHE